jgi:hypothetical protein
VDESERFLGVAGYRPQHVHTVDELGPHRDRLRSLVGRTLRGSVAMWDAGDDEWFTDGPLILQFDEVRLEVAAFKLHLCVSWNAIDVERDIEWCPGSTFELEWRRDALAAIEALRGQAVGALSLVEYRGGLNGLGLRAGDGYAEVFNALDELGLRDRVAHDPEVTRVPV